MRHALRPSSSARLRAMLWGWLILPVLLGCGAVRAAPVQVTDARGVTQTWAAPPQRLVSLLPSITESVCALGACDRLIGVDRYSNWPERVQRLPQLGGLEDAMVERIVALRPDAVLLARSARVIERLEALGLKVVVVQAETHAEVRNALALLARLLGEPARAEALWAGFQADLGRAAQRVPPAWRGKRVYFEVASTPYAAGASSFIGETLVRLGLGNVVTADLGPFPQLNPEYVIRAQPDLLMAAAQNLAEMPGRPGWSRLRAMQAGHRCGFAPARYDVLVRPGPRLGEAALLLADCVASLPSAGAPASAPGASPTTTSATPRTAPAQGGVAR